MAPHLSADLTKVQIYKIRYLHAQYIYMYTQPDISWKIRIIWDFRQRCLTPTCRIQNPDTLRAVGSVRRTAGRRGGGWVGRDAVGSIRPGDNPPSLSSSKSKKLPCTTLRKNEQTKSYLNRWRNEIRGCSAGNPFHARHVREPMQKQVVN